MPDFTVPAHGIGAGATFDAMELDPKDSDSYRGTKRKAGELEEPKESQGSRRIKALHQDVINKIAAGEIIVAPVHALKELIENAVDAGSTALEVICREGGLKLLQITDNGCGIEKEDLPILCERFTTSKLQKFEDLSSIATYGFRGEALASISHIAHLTVTTKTKDSNSAWRAHYDGGKLVPSKPGQSPDPKPVAGRPGTQITVEDLFYNVPTRRRAFRSASDEYNKIIDMVGRYAVHCSHVAFSCKKHNEPTTSIAVQASASVVDRIRQIYGSSVANELLQYETADARWGFKAQGWATNANYSIKKTTFLLFINHRSVESTNIRKAMEQAYAAFLPKNGHPFVYLSLDIDPHRVDVNVHPTKREVNFLNEDEIIQAICEHLRGKLAAVDTSRTFRTQTLLPTGGGSSKGGAGPSSTKTLPTPRRDTGAHTAKSSSSGGRKSGAPTRPYENNLVRTDTNLRKITSMLPPAAPSACSRTKTGTGAGAGAVNKEGPSVARTTAAGPPVPIEYETVDRDPNPLRLGSVRELRAAVRDDVHHELTEVLANHTFVGVVDEARRLAAIQGGVRLYLIDYGRACFEYFYQLGLTDFANMGAIRFSPRLDLRELLTVAAEHEIEERRRGRRKRKGKEPEDLTLREEGDGDGDEEEHGNDCDIEAETVVEKVAEKLITFREMLLEYFSLEITPTGELVSIPLLVKGYTPPLVKLPQFLLRLGPHVVDYADEKACLGSILRELASFYVPEQLPPAPSHTEKGKGAGGDEEGDEHDGGQQQQQQGAVDSEIEARRKEIRWAVEHVFFPAFKARLVATNTLIKGGVLEVANLKGLYRVFERC